MSYESWRDGLKGMRIRVDLSVLKDTCKMIIRVNAVEECDARDDAKDPKLVTQKSSK